MAALFLVFKGTSILFSTVAIPIYIPTYSVRWFPSLQTFTKITVCKLFDDHSDCCELMSNCSFDMHFSSNSVQFSCSVVSDSLKPQGLQHIRLSCPSPTPGACSNLRPLSWWCHPTNSSTVIPFSPCLQSFPASGSLPMRQFFALGGQSITASPLVPPTNIHDWFPLGLTGLTFLPSKELSRVFSNTTVQKCQFFGAQLSLQSNSYIHTWLLEKP